MSEEVQSEVQSFIRETVTDNPVVLFMKGTAQFPQCGFSARAIQVLKAVGVTKLVTVNVLEDAEVRQGIKDYANWPATPPSESRSCRARARAAAGGSRIARPWPR